MTKLYVICGHGAGDPGAVGGGKNEAALVRQLAAHMRAIGGSNVEVLDTSKNWFASDLVNSALKRKVGSSPVIELHMDSADVPARGGHVEIKKGYSPDAWDKALAANIAKMFPGRDDRIRYRSDLANVNRAATYGINYRLLECCFISDSADRAKFTAQMDDVAKAILAAFGISTGAVPYRIVKNNLIVWDAPKKGARRLTTMPKGAVKSVTGTVEADGLLWAAFTAKATGKTRYFKIGTLDGKTVYAEKA